MVCSRHMFMCAVKRVTNIYFGHICMCLSLLRMLLQYFVRWGHVYFYSRVRHCRYSVLVILFRDFSTSRSIVVSEIKRLFWLFKSNIEHHTYCTYVMKTETVAATSTSINSFSLTKFRLYDAFPKSRMV